MPDRSTNRFSFSIPLHLPVLALTLTAAGCLGQGGEPPPATDAPYDDDEGVESTEQAAAIYGKEITLNPFNWARRPLETVCRLGSKYSSPVCTYGASGAPAATSYSLLPKEKGRVLKWDAARFINAEGVTPEYPVLSVNTTPKSRVAVVTVKGQRVGDVLVRLPVNYDNFTAGQVHGSVRFRHTFNTPEKLQKASRQGNVVLVLQQRLDDGSPWVDVAKADAPRPLLTQQDPLFVPSVAQDGSWSAQIGQAVGNKTINLPAPTVLEVSAEIEPGADVRLELRVGRDYGDAPEAYLIEQVRLFAPMCPVEGESDDCP